MNPSSQQRRPGPLVLEIIGVAGSGKSSLATALTDANEGWRIEGPLEMRNKRHLPYVVHGAAPFSRIAAANLLQRRRLTWKESKYLLYVMEWGRRLSSIPARESAVIVLDQGPVYVLTRFGTNDVPVSGCEPGGRWWSAITADWAETLHGVIALDAPDSVLWERITSRERSHEALERGRSAWSTFAGNYRRSFDTVLAAMAVPDGPQILRYDTSLMSTAQIASDVTERVAVGWSHGERSLGAADDIEGSSG